LLHAAQEELDLSAFVEQRSKLALTLLEYGLADEVLHVV